MKFLYNTIYDIPGCYLIDDYGTAVEIPYSYGAVYFFCAVE